MTSISSVTRRGLDLPLTHAAAHPGGGALEAAVDFADSVNRFLDIFGLRQERAGAAGGLTRAEYLALSNRGAALLSAGRTREVEALFRDLLARIPAAGDAWDYERALTSNRIGRQRAAQGRPEQAVAAYRDALAGLARLAQRATVRRQIDVTRTNLADALTDLKR